MKLFSSTKRIKRLSAWITLQALILTQVLPAPAWAGQDPAGRGHLRGQPPTESVAASGLEESLTAQSRGRTVEAAVEKHFAPGSGREGEIALEGFLSERWVDQVRAAAGAMQSAANASDRRSAEEALRAAVRRHEEQIDEFARLVKEDRLGAGVPSEGQELGPYRLPPIDPQEIPAPGQRSGSGGLAIEIPSDRAVYELERLHLMARAAIQRALGRQVVVNVGIGFVGTAVSTATAAESRRDFGKIPAKQRKRLKYRGPLEGRQEAYFTIAYQRPSPASAYKVPAMNRGVSPISTKDPAVGEKIAETTRKGTLAATYLSGSIALADTVMLETELHAAKVLPTHLEHSRVEDEATVRLMQQVGRLMRPDALVIVESTIGPGFLRNRLLPAVNQELQRRGVLGAGQNANLAHAFQRLEPGPRWYRSLLEQERVGAGVTAEANRKLEDYLRTVGFRYRLFPRVEAVEFMKTLENAWRFGLMELMIAYVRAAEIVGVDGFEIARLIARARPTTHNLIQAIPSIQPGGYCVPKELILIIGSLADNYGISSAEIMEIFNTRLGAAVASDFRGRTAVARTAEALAAEGMRLDDARVHVLGVAYNEGTPDTRMSGVERAVRELAALGVLPSHITLADPYAALWPEIQQQQLTSPESWGYGLPNQQDLSSLQVRNTADAYSTLNPDQDVVLMGTRHREYVGKNRLNQEREQLRADGKTAELKRLEGVEGLDPVKMTARMLGREGKVLIDTFDFFSDEDYKLFLALGWQVRALGKGHLADLEKGFTPEERIRAVEALLGELRAQRDQPGVDPEGLRQAVETTRAKLRSLKARPREAAAREREYRKEKARQELLDTRNQLHRALERLDDEDPRVLRLQRRVEMAAARRDGRKAALERLEQDRRRDIAEYMEQSVVQPAVRRAAGLIKRSSFMHGVPARYLMTHRPLAAPDEARVDQAARGPVRRAEFLLLANYLDQAFHMLDYLLVEVFSAGKIDQMLRDVRHREESAHLERTLHPERRTIPYWIYGDGGKVVRKTKVQADLVRPFRWRTNLETGDLEVETDPDHWMNYTLKQLPDMLRAEVPEHWGRYFVVVKPRLVPVEGAQLRAYPPGFDDLPPEFAMWFAREVVGKGYMLTTLDGPGAVEQDKVKLVMVVDPHGAGSGRAGYLVWADSNQPVVSVTPEGYEVVTSIKGIGLFIGGNPEFAHTTVQTLGTTTGRIVSGGMVKDGTVGQSTLAQAPGYVTGVGSEHGLTLMSTARGYHDGLAPRLSFGVNYRFRDAPEAPGGAPTEYFSAAREEFTTGRLGWRPRGRPFNGRAEAARAARALGWNAAELLAHLGVPTIHIALTLDNVQDNGYFTDPDSIVPPLYRERNPYGALFKYFGFSMQNTVWGWLEMKASRKGEAFEVPGKNLQLLQPWLRGFMAHLLESDKVRREPFEKFNRFSKLPRADFLKALRSEYGRTSNRDLFQAVAIDLIDALWNHYLAYEILKNRIQYGYSHTVESTYTGTANERWNPASEEDARRYLLSQRQILEISRRLIQGGAYPALPFDFDSALQEVGQREQRLNQLMAQRAGDFREVYPLSFYKSETASVVSILDLDAVMAGERPIHIAGEIPAGAPLVEKEVMTARPKPPAGAKAGLEEKPLGEVVDLRRVRVVDEKGQSARIGQAQVVLVTLDAGKGTRFDPAGRSPKVLAPLGGIPLGMRPKKDVERHLGWPIISVVGYMADEVMAAYSAHSDKGIIFARSENPGGGTGYALYHAAAVPGLRNSRALVVATAGDQPLYDAQLFQSAADRCLKTKSDLVLGVARVTQERAKGKGRIVRLGGKVVGVVEQRDIDSMTRAGKTRFGHTREQLDAITEVNISLYAARARILFPLLERITNGNAQGQYYATDIVAAAARRGYRIETLEVPMEKARDVTTPEDLQALERQVAGEVTLQQWMDLLKTGRTNWLADSYTGDLETHRARLNEWTARLLQREIPGRPGTSLFDSNRPVVVVRTPGRFLFPVTGRHLDYLGMQGGSIGSPTEQEVVLFTQEADGLSGRGEIYQIEAPDPSVARDYPNSGLGARTVSLNDPFVNPDQTIRTPADWDSWAAAVTKQRRERRAPDPKINYADDLAGAVVAFSRTEFGDPSGKIRAYLDRLAAEGKGLRFALASDLPTGGGLSSSSVLVIAFAQTLAALAGAELTPDQLVNFGYAERFYAGTQGGVKDHAHIVHDTGFLGVAPTRTIATMEPVPGASVLLLDSGISRDNAPRYSPKLASSGNDEQNIKGRSATGYALAGLWLRHVHPELTERIAPDHQYVDGYLRNLVPGSSNGLSVLEFYRLLREMPAEGLTRSQMYTRMPEFRADLERLFKDRPEPPEPYAIREMLLFAFAEESRNWEVVRTLNALKAGEISLDQAFERLVQIGRAAHNGDRVTRYQITPGSGDSVVITDAGWDWRLSDETLDRYIADPDADEAALWRQAGRLERSIEPLDRLVDLVEYFNQSKGGNTAVAAVMGAGLGGTVGVFARDEVVEELTQFLDKHYYQPLGLSHGPVIRAQAGRGATVLTAQINAGLEELPAEQEEAIELPDRARWAEATDPDRNLIQSFSGIRAVVGEDVPLPVVAPLPDTELSPENRLIFGRYGYIFARRQIAKFRQAQPSKREFAFVLARDPRPSGRAVLDAQARGMLAASAEMGARVRFINGGVMPTPFAEGLVRMKGADGGVIVTASHNPLLWNGVKYPTAAAEPGEALVSGGILLVAGEMSGVVEEFQSWAGNVRDDLSVGERFGRQMDGANPLGFIEPVRSEEVVAHMVSEARSMWGLADDAAFDEFKRKAGKVRIVLDPNGGAASGYYMQFLGSFGFTVIEINDALGRPRHKLEPVDDALVDAKEALLRAQAHFAIVFDYDADRGNTLFGDPATGAIMEPGPQEVAAMNVAMALARATLQREQSGGDARPLAVVVHDATSRRAWEIAQQVFGAEVAVVEVGEVNVLEKMRDLERKGYHVVIGVEGANGGSVFRGDDSRVRGDTSRNGAMTALFTGMLLVQPEIGRRWLELRNGKRPSGVDPAPVAEKPTLIDLVKSLPGEHGQGAWRFVTPIEKMGKRADVPKDMVVPFKRALEGIFRWDYWPVWQARGIPLGGGDFQRFSDVRIIHHAETSESPAFSLSDPSGSGLDQYGQGGWRMELTTSEGNHAFVWFRGSLTEGQMRASAEGQGPEGERIARALMRVIRDEWYPAALNETRRQPAGLEEVDVDRLLRQKAEFGELVSQKSGIGVIAGPQGLGYGVALTRARGFDGKLFPVVMIVENERQKELAEKVASSAYVILLSEHEGDVRRAVEAAKEYLAVVGVESLEVGTDGEVDPDVALQLSRFGIVPESIQLWTDFIRDATLAFQA